MAPGASSSRQVHLRLPGGWAFPRARQPRGPRGGRRWRRRRRGYRDVAAAQRGDDGGALHAADAQEAAVPWEIQMGCSDVPTHYSYLEVS